MLSNESKERIAKEKQKRKALRDSIAIEHPEGFINYCNYMSWNEIIMIDGKLCEKPFIR